MDVRNATTAALGLVWLLAGGCSGEDGAAYAIVGSLEGASFAPAAPGLRAPDAAGIDGDAIAETAVEPAAAALEPAAVPAPKSGHNPGDGVKAARPAKLPAGLRYLAFEDVTWPEYEPLDMRDVDAEAYPTSAFPEAVRGLDGARVAFDGYMVPVDFENRRVTSFILSRYLPGCCFGVMPRMDEWIEVAVEIAGGVEYVPYQVVRVIGTFEVGEKLDDYGYVRSIYRIRADEVDEQL
jgi:hypothetical protein